MLDNNAIKRLLQSSDRNAIESALVELSSQEAKAFDQKNASLAVTLIQIQIMLNSRLIAIPEGKPSPEECADLYRKIAKLWMKINETDKAIGQLRKAMELEKDSAETLELMTLAYMKATDEKEALEGPSMSEHEKEVKTRELAMQEQLSINSSRGEQTKILTDKESSLVSLQELLQYQAKEADLVRERLESLKQTLAKADGEGSLHGISEMDTRLKLVEKTLHDLRSNYEDQMTLLDLERKWLSDVGDDVSEMLEDSAKGGVVVPQFKGEIEKLGRLRDVVHSLDAQLTAAAKSTATTEEKREADKKIEALREKLESHLAVVASEMRGLVDIKKSTYEGLKEILQNQAKDAERVQQTIAKIKDEIASRTRVGSPDAIAEMETRLNLAEKALLELQDKYNSKTEIIEAERHKIKDNGETHNADLDESVKILSSASVSNGDLREEISKLYRLRDIVSSLDAQLKAAASPPPGESPPGSPQASSAEVLEEKKVFIEGFLSIVADSLRELDDMDGRLARIKSSATEAKEEGAELEDFEARMDLSETGVSDLRQKLNNVGESLAAAVAAIENPAEGKLTGLPDSLSCVSVMSDALSKLRSIRDSLTLFEAEVGVVRPVESEALQNEVHICNLASVLEEKTKTSKGLIKIIKTQGRELGPLQARLSVLQSSVSSDPKLGDLKTKVALATQGIREVKGKYSEMKERLASDIKDIEENDTSELNHVAPSPISAAEVSELVSKQSRLSGIVAFLEAQAKPGSTEGGSNDSTQLSPDEKATLVEGKKKTTAGLRQIIETQAKEVGLMQGKVSVLSQAISTEKANGVAPLGDMETRLSLASTGVDELKAKYSEMIGLLDADDADRGLLDDGGRLASLESSALLKIVTTSSVSTVELSECVSKLYRLRDVLSLLDTQMRSAKAAQAEAASRAASANASQLQDRSASVENKKKSTAGVRRIIEDQSREIGRLNQKMTMLAQMLSSVGTDAVGVRDVEARLKLAEKGIRELEGDCVQMKDAIDRETKTLDDYAQVTKLDSNAFLQLVSSSPVSMLSLSESVSKLTRMRDVLVFIEAQLKPSSNEQSSATKASSDVAVGDRRSAVDKKKEANAGLRDMVENHADQVALLESKVSTLAAKGKDMANSREVGSRMNLAKRGVQELQNGCRKMRSAVQNVANTLDDSGRISKMDSDAFLDLIATPAFSFVDLSDAVAKASLIQGAIAELDGKVQDRSGVEVSENKPSAEGVRQIVEDQIQEASALGSRVSALNESIAVAKSKGVALGDMEMRFKLTAKGAEELEKKYGEMKASLDSDAQAGQQGGRVVRSSVSVGDLSESISKLYLIRDALSFLETEMESVNNMGLISQKKELNAGLLQIIENQIGEASRLDGIVAESKQPSQSRDTQTNLKLSGMAIQELRTKLTGMQKVLAAEQKSLDEREKLRSIDSAALLVILSKSQVSMTELNESIAKLGLIRDSLGSINGGNKESTTTARALDTGSLIENQSAVNPTSLIENKSASLVENKKKSNAGLRHIIENQMLEAKRLQARVASLDQAVAVARSEGLGVGDMESRLRLAQKGADVLATKFTEMKAFLDADKELLNDQAKINSMDPNALLDILAGSSISVPELSESVSKLYRIRDVLSFLEAQVKVSKDAESTAEAKRNAAMYAGALADFQKSSYDGLSQIVANQTQEAARLLQRVGTLRKMTASGENHGDLELRLKLAAKGVEELQLKFGEMKSALDVNKDRFASSISIVDLGQSISKLLRLRDIVALFEAQLKVQDEKIASNRLMTQTEALLRDTAGMVESRKQANKEVRQMIDQQSREVGRVQQKATMLRNAMLQSKSNLGDVEARLRLAEAGAAEILATYSHMKSILDEEDERLQNTDITKTPSMKAVSTSKVSMADVSASVAKLDRIRDVLSFLGAQIRGAETKDTSSTNVVNPTAIKDAKNGIGQIVASQANEANRLQSRLVMLERSQPQGGSGSDFETRLRLAMQGVSELKAKFDQMKQCLAIERTSALPPVSLVDLSGTVSKVQRLRDITSFLEAQVKAANENSEGEQVKTVCSSLIEKNAKSISGLRQIVDSQAQEAARLNHRMFVLSQDVGNAKSEGVDLGDMEMRLRLVGTGLREVTTKTSNMKDILENDKNEVVAKMRTTGTDSTAFLKYMNNASFSATELSESSAKLGRLRNVLVFLEAQVRQIKGAKTNESSSSAVNSAAIKDAKNGLSQIVTSQSNEANQLQSRLIILERSRPEGGGDFETRMKLAMKGVNEIQAKFEQMRKCLAIERTSALPPISLVELSQSVSKVLRLRDIVRFLEAQVKAADDNRQGEQIKTVCSSLSTKNSNSNAGLRQLVDNQAREAARLNYRISLLSQEVTNAKNDGVELGDLDMRLKLAASGLVDVTTKTGFMKDTLEADQQVVTKLRTTGTDALAFLSQMNAGSFSVADLSDSSAKLGRIRDVLVFFEGQVAQIRGARTQDSSSSGVNTAAIKDAKNGLGQIVVSQTNEANRLQSRLVVLEQSQQVGSGDFKARLKLAMQGIAAVQVKCVQMKQCLSIERTSALPPVSLVDLSQTVSKILSLRDIVKFLEAQVKAAMENRANEPVKSICGSLVTKKANANSGLRQILDNQAREAARLDRRMSLLARDVATAKDDGVNLGDLDMRMKLATKTLEEVTIRTNNMKDALAVEEQAVGPMRTAGADADAATFLRNMNTGSFSISELSDSSAKLGRVRDVLAFFEGQVAQIKGAKNKDSSGGVNMAAIKDAKKGLSEIVASQTAEANQLQSKLVVLERSRPEGGGDFEARMKLAMQGVNEVQAKFEQMKKCLAIERTSALPPVSLVELSHTVSKVQRLRDVVRFLDAQVKCAIENRENEPIRSICSSLANKKAQSNTGLRQIVDNQAREAARLNQRMSVLSADVATAKGEGVNLGDMEMRLKLMASGLEEVTTKFNNMKGILDAEDVVAGKLKTTGADSVAFVKHMEGTSFSSTELSDSAAKLGRIRDVLVFLEAQVRGVKAQKAEESRIATIGALMKIEKDALDGFSQILSNQTREVGRLQGRLTFLRNSVEKSNSKLGDMVARITLAEKGIADLQKQCDDMKTNLDENGANASFSVVELGALVSKVLRLRDVIAFLEAQLKAVSEKEGGNYSSAKDLSLLLGNKKKWIEKKVETNKALRQIVDDQSRDVGSLQAKISMLAQSIAAGDKEGVNLGDIQTRLKLAGNGVEEMQRKYAEMKQSLDKDGEALGDEEKVASYSPSTFLQFISTSSVSLSDLSAFVSRLYRIRAILSLMEAQVKSADAQTTSEAMVAKMAEARKDTNEGLSRIVAKQAQEASLLQVRLARHQMAAKSGLGDFEARMNLASKGIEELRARFTDMKERLDQDKKTFDDNGGAVVDRAKKFAKVMNISSVSMVELSEAITKMFGLRDIVGIVDSQIKAIGDRVKFDKADEDSRALVKVRGELEEVKKEKFEAQKALVVARTKDLEKEDEKQTAIEQTKELLILQHDETLRLQRQIARMDKRGSIITLMLRLPGLVVSFLAVSALLILLLWYSLFVDRETATQFFDMACSPAMPGTRIMNSTGPLASPFWVPTTYKERVFEKLCGDRPRVQLEIKDETLYISELLSNKMNYRASWVIRAASSTSAFVGTDTIGVVDMEGWHKDLPAPWTLN